MERLLDGEGKALDALVKRYEGSLFGFCFRLMGERGAAEDAFQETFLRVYRRRFSYKRGASVKPWLFQIALNVCRDQLRKRKRRPEVALVEETVVEEVDPGPEEMAERKFEAERVKAALHQLPEKQRDVLVLSHYQNLSYPEIAETLDIPTGTVKSRVFHALRKLGKILKGGPTQKKNKKN